MFQDESDDSRIHHFFIASAKFIPSTKSIPKEVPLVCHVFLGISLYYVVNQSFINLTHTAMRVQRSFEVKCMRSSVARAKQSSNSSTTIDVVSQSDLVAFQLLPQKFRIRSSVVLTKFGEKSLNLH